MVVRARWTMGISLDSSAVEHLTSDALGVPGSIPGPAVYFHLYFFVYFFVFIHSSHPYYRSRDTSLT